MFHVLYLWFSCAVQVQGGVWAGDGGLQLPPAYVEGPGAGGHVSLEYGELTHPGRNNSTGQYSTVHHCTELTVKDKRASQQ